MTLARRRDVGDADLHGPCRSRADEASLPDLGPKLELPEGWEYKTVTLDRDLTITTDGVAHVVPDHLANMYQGCIQGVNSFDPWI